MAMTLWLVWLSVVVIGAAWFSLVALLCRQIAAGKWDPDYWPPEPTSVAEPIELDELKQDLEEEVKPGRIVEVRFTREGGFSEN